MTILLSLIFIGISIAVMSIFKYLKKQRKTFNFRVLSALFLGVLFGLLVKLIFDYILIEYQEVTNQLIIFLGIISGIYIKLLQLMVIPLVFVAMTTAVMNLESLSSLAKIVPKVLSVLIGTVMISAVVGISVMYIFNIDATELSNEANTESAEDVALREESLNEKQAGLENQSYDALILSFIPENVFYMLAGTESTATLSTVLFGMFLGYAILQVRKRKPEKVQVFVDFINASKEIVLSLVREVLKLTPYGIFALMAVFMIENSILSLGELLEFLLASYTAIIIVFIIHLLLLYVFKLNPVQYLKKSWAVLVFGFGSRASMAALPLNIETQNEIMGVDLETANISATFGTSIGQNGCAGIYPTMIAVLTAQAVGIDMTFSWFLSLIVVVAISSFGIAGVGGGATFAAVAVLSIMGLPLQYAALLISIEPLIDMARTALNISDSMVAGLITSKSNKTLDIELYNK